MATDRVDILLTSSEIEDLASDPQPWKRHFRGKKRKTSTAYSKAYAVRADEEGYPGLASQFVSCATALAS